MGLDMKRLGLGAQIAGLCAVLLLIDMFLSWYSLNVPDQVAQFAPQADLSVNAWQAYGVNDILMFVTIIVVLGWVAMRATGKTVALPVAASVIALALAVLTLVVILIRVVLDQPGPDNDLVNNEIGAYIGIVLLAGMAYGSFVGMKTEGAKFGPA